MQKKISKSIKIFEETVKGITEYPVTMEGSEDFSYRIDEMSRMLLRMRRATKRELVGYFTLNEACLIYDAIYNVIYAGEVGAKDVLIWQIDDVTTVDKLDKKWGVDSGRLKYRIEMLSEFQAYTVISNIYEARGRCKDDDIRKVLADIFLMGKFGDDDTEIPDYIFASKARDDEPLNQDEKK